VNRALTSLDLKVEKDVLNYNERQCQSPKCWHGFCFSNLREIGICNGMAFWMIDKANDDRTEIDDGQKREEKGEESRQIRTFPRHHGCAPFKIIRL
jgi:hypothetical protein